jgi:hypothetical protein
MGIHGITKHDFELYFSWEAETSKPASRQALRHLLYLFGKDEAIKLIRAG